MMDIFKNHVNTYDLRNKKCWGIGKVRTVAYGTETIRSRDPKTWDMVPHHIKDSKTLAELNPKSGRGNQSSAHVGCVKHLYHN